MQERKFAHIISYKCHIPIYPSIRSSPFQGIQTYANVKVDGHWYFSQWQWLTMTLTITVIFSELVPSTCQWGITRVGSLGPFGPKAKDPAAKSQCPDLTTNPTWDVGVVLRWEVTAKISFVLKHWFSALLCFGGRPDSMETSLFFLFGISPYVSNFAMHLWNSLLFLAAEMFQGARRISTLVT